MKNGEMRLPRLAELSLVCELRRLSAQLEKVVRPKKSRLYRARRGRVTIPAATWTRVVLADSGRVYLNLSTNPVVSVNWAWPPVASPAVAEGFVTSGQFAWLELFAERHHDLPKYEWMVFNPAVGATALFVELTEV